MLMRNLVLASSGSLHDKYLDQLKIQIRVIIWAPSRENLHWVFSAEQDSNYPAQLQRLSRILKICIKQVKIIVYFPIIE